MVTALTGTGMVGFCCPECVGEWKTLSAGEQATKIAEARQFAETPDHKDCVGRDSTHCELVPIFKRSAGSLLGHGSKAEVTNHGRPIMLP